MGIGKREATYVPDGLPRRTLMKMSKADLAELVWDYARQCAGGDEADPTDVVAGITQRRAVVKAARS